MDDQEEALSIIRRHVWAGWFDLEEIAIIVSEEFGESDESDQDWLEAEIEKEMSKKRAEEATWPKTTDCDRLDKVFEKLESAGILALQDAGMTKSDGHEDVEDEYQDAGGEDSDIVGYCFYHGQDLERVMAGGDLCLAFGHIRGDDKIGTDIGHRIKKLLEEAGFTVEWSGSVRERILARGIRWQRRTGSG